jgi:DNA-binding MarR family transcriptional regulator
MLTQELVDLLVQAARVVLAEREGSRLTSSQWTALRFFARANTFSRTLSGLAAYQATTRGTGSQTIKSLEKAGLLERGRSELDGRSSILRLTAKGRRLLDEDPIAGLIDVFDTLDDGSKHALRKALRNVVVSLPDGRPWKPVGSCKDCCFLLTRRQRSDSGPACTKICKSIGLPIEDTDLDLLCVSFEPIEEIGKRA